MYLLSATLAPHLGWLGPWAGYICSYVLCVGLACLLCHWGLRSPLPGRSARALACLALALIGGLGVIRGVSLAHLLASSLALLSIAFLIGLAIANRIQKAAHLLPVALVAATADLWSVLAPSGLTQQILAKPEYVPLLVLCYPYLGTPDIPPFIGAADFCMATLFVATADRFDLPRQRARLSIAIGFLLTLIAVVVTGLPVPALPFLSAVFVALHPATLRLDAKEWRQLLLFVVLFGGLGLALRLV